MASRYALGIGILLLWSAVLRGDEVQLTKFTSQGGKFTILLPKDPVTRIHTAETPLGKLRVTLTGQKHGDTHFAVAYTDYSDKVKEFDTEKALDGARDGSLKNNNGKLIQEKKITLGKAKYPGRELLVRARTGELWVRQRIYMVGLRQYQVVLVGSEGMVKSKTAERFFQSFELDE